MDVSSPRATWPILNPAHLSASMVTSKPITESLLASSRPHHSVQPVHSRVSTVGNVPTSSLRHPTHHHTSPGRSFYPSKAPSNASSLCAFIESHPTEGIQSPPSRHTRATRHSVPPKTHVLSPVAAPTQSHLNWLLRSLNNRHLPQRVDAILSPPHLPCRNVIVDASSGLSWGVTWDVVEAEKGAGTGLGESAVKVTVAVWSVECEFDAWSVDVILSHEAAGMRDDSTGNARDATGCAINANRVTVIRDKDVLVVFFVDNHFMAHVGKVHVGPVGQRLATPPRCSLRSTSLNVDPVCRPLPIITTPHSRTDHHNFIEDAPAILHLTRVSLAESVEGATVADVVLVTHHGRIFTVRVSIEGPTRLVMEMMPVVHVSGDWWLSMTVAGTAPRGETAPGQRSVRGKEGWASTTRLGWMTSWLGKRDEQTAMIGEGERWRDDNDLRAEGGLGERLSLGCGGVRDVFFLRPEEKMNEAFTSPPIDIPPSPLICLVITHTRLSAIPSPRSAEPLSRFPLQLAVSLAIGKERFYSPSGHLLPDKNAEAEWCCGFIAAVDEPGDDNLLMGYSVTLLPIILSTTRYDSERPVTSLFMSLLTTPPRVDASLSFRIAELPSARALSETGVTHSPGGLPCWASHIQLAVVPNAGLAVLVTVPDEVKRARACVFRGAVLSDVVWKVIRVDVSNEGGGARKSSTDFQVSEVQRYLPGWLIWAIKCVNAKRPPPLLKRSNEGRGLEQKEEWGDLYVYTVGGCEARMRLVVEYQRQQRGEDNLSERIEGLSIVAPDVNALTARRQFLSNLNVRVMRDKGMGLNIEQMVIDAYGMWRCDRTAECDMLVRQLMFGAIDGGFDNARVQLFGLRQGMSEEVIAAVNCAVVDYVNQLVNSWIPIERLLSKRSLRSAKIHMSDVTEQRRVCVDGEGEGWSSVEQGGDEEMIVGDGRHGAHLPLVIHRQLASLVSAFCLSKVDAVKGFVLFLDSVGLYSHVHPIARLEISALLEQVFVLRTFSSYHKAETSVYAHLMIETCSSFHSLYNLTDAPRYAADLGSSLTKANDTFTHTKVSPHPYTVHQLGEFVNEQSATMTTSMVVDGGQTTHRTRENGEQGSNEQAVEKLQMLLMAYSRPTLTVPLVLHSILKRLTSITNESSEMPLEWYTQTAASLCSPRLMTRGGQRHNAAKVASALPNWLQPEVMSEVDTICRFVADYLTTSLECHEQFAQAWDLPPTGTTRHSLHPPYNALLPCSVDPPSVLHSGWIVRSNPFDGFPLLLSPHEDGHSATTTASPQPHHNASARPTTRTDKPHKHCVYWNILSIIDQVTLILQRCRLFCDEVRSASGLSEVAAALKLAEREAVEVSDRGSVFRYGGQSNEEAAQQEALFTLAHSPVGKGRISNVDINTPTALLDRIRYAEALRETEIDSTQVNGPGVGGEKDDEGHLEVWAILEGVIESIQSSCMISIEGLLGALLRVFYWDLLQDEFEMMKVEVLSRGSHIYELRQKSNKSLNASMPVEDSGMSTGGEVETEQEDDEWSDLVAMSLRYQSTPFLIRLLFSSDDRSGLLWYCMRRWPPFSAHCLTVMSSTRSFHHLFLQCPPDILASNLQLITAVNSEVGWAVAMRVARHGTSLSLDGNGVSTDSDVAVDWRRAALSVPLAMVSKAARGSVEEVGGKSNGVQSDLGERSAIGHVNLVASQLAARQDGSSTLLKQSVYLSLASLGLVSLVENHKAHKSSQRGATRDEIDTLPGHRRNMITALLVAKRLSDEMAKLSRDQYQPLPDQLHPDQISSIFTQFIAIANRRLCSATSIESLNGIDHGMGVSSGDLPFDETPVYWTRLLRDSSRILPLLSESPSAQQELSSDTLKMFWDSVVIVDLPWLKRSMGEGPASMHVDGHVMPALASQTLLYELLKTPGVIMPEGGSEELVSIGKERGVFAAVALLAESTAHNRMNSFVPNAYADGKKNKPQRAPG
eukprot:GHVN01034123.1.p1 GENE.GHVN01034123.1~~GHVN01034123.1.p1  ORF type:complete len:1953 (-),score=402.10 GHVN01034123.1:4194-10052(-)